MRDQSQVDNGGFSTGLLACSVSSPGNLRIGIFCPSTGSRLNGPMANMNIRQLPQIMAE